MRSFIIAPSILSADLACLGQEATAVLAAGADWIHFDAMDNHYVPNLTFGPSLCLALREYGIKAVIDVHLMVEPVDDLIVAFAKAGASRISFHPEASRHVDRSIQLIHDHGCQAGLAFNITTSLDLLEHVLEKIDHILLMSVNPGFSGQAFMPAVFDKVKMARELIKKSGKDIRLAVDGGVSLENILALARAGADTFISGSAIFKTKDYAETLKKFRLQLTQS